MADSGYLRVGRRKRAFPTNGLQSRLSRTKGGRVMDDRTEGTLTDEEIRTVLPGGDVATKVETVPDGDDADGTDGADTEDGNDADGTDTKDADGTDGDTGNGTDGDSTDTA
jgi:hypothetical protein